MVRRPDERLRLTQAERSAISRDKIVRAAIQCLVHVGYSATSFSLIAATAGISTGRMQHHFANKADIMGAVIEFIRQQNNRLLALRKLKANEPEARVLEYVQLIKRSFESEYVAAAIEIRMAMKGDAELAAVVEPRFRQYDTESFSDLERLLTNAGMETPAAHVWMRLIVSTLRGMAMERVAGYRILDQVDADTALAVLAEQMFRPPDAAKRARWTGASEPDESHGN